MSNIQQQFNTLLGVAAIGGRLYQDTPHFKEQMIRQDAAKAETAYEKISQMEGPGLDDQVDLAYKNYAAKTQNLANTSGKPEDIAKAAEVHSYGEEAEEAMRTEAEKRQAAAEKQAFSSAFARMVTTNDTKEHLAIRKELLKSRGEKK